MFRFCSFVPTDSHFLYLWILLFKGKNAVENIQLKAGETTLYCDMMAESQNSLTREVVHC
jgi:hypothetical protein